MAVRDYPPVWMDGTDPARRDLSVRHDGRPSSVNDIVEVIKYDEALTGQVLRLCNSAYFGRSRQLSSLNDAMCCLSTAKVIQLVMAVHTRSTLSREQVGYLRKDSRHLSTP